MTAPALVMISHGSNEPTVSQVAHRLSRDVQNRRSELIVKCAFLDQGTPKPQAVVNQLVRLGVSEIVYVPLNLTNAIAPGAEIEELVQRSNALVTEARFVASRPLGPEISLLNVLDQRLRTSLSTARILELDGLVLSAPSGGDVRGAALLARRARQWSAHHRLPCLTAAADGSGPNVSQAIATLRAQGRRHIAVGSLFLAADEWYCSQAALALRSGAVAVSEPIGGAEEIMDLVLARYAFAAMELLDFAESVAGGHTGDDVALANLKPNLSVVGA